MTEPPDRYAVLRIRDFRPALAVRFFDGLAIQMLNLAAGWQIYQLTRDPLLLGLIGLSEGLPYITVALWAGHAADRREKRGIIAGAEAVICATALCLTLLARLDKPPLPLLYALIACGGLCRSFQWTAMSAYLQQVVPKEIFPKAAAWSTSMWHAATIAGPALGGLLYSLFGAAATYGTVAACFLAAWSFALRMRKVPVSEDAPAAPGLQDLLSGIRFVFSQQVILAAMSLDMFGVFFGGVEGIMPIFAERLGAGPTGLGILRAAPAVGALASSLFLAHHSFKRMGATFVSCVAAFGLCMIAFAFSRSFALSLLILAAGGAVDGTGMVLRASIYQALTPASLRGRVSSVNGIFIRMSNQIGSFESGLAAKLMGLVPSVVFGGCVTLASVAAALWRAPALGHFPERAPTERP